MNRFTKLDAAAAALPDDAAQWLAVLDNTTQLIWTKNAISEKQLKYAAANKAVDKFELMGAKDWRLPTVEELFSLADRTRFNPAIDPAFFPDTPSDWFWTSTPDASSPADYAWIVNFYHGYAYYYYQDHTAFVRAVRSARASQ